jgi:hypothetical protein
MWLPFYVLLLAVGIAVAIFAIKLVVSLRVAHNAPAWQTVGNQKSGTAKTDVVRGERHSERVLVVVDPVPVAKRVRRSSSKQQGKRKKVAGKVARKFSSESF